MDSGYIYHWRIDAGTGRIRVCSGDFAELNVRFSGDECDKPLKKILAEQNISKDRVCPPPDNVLLVTFNLTVESGSLVAHDISLS